jgi:hypothetical protein
MRPHLLKYSLIRSLVTLSGRLPTHRCLVSRTITNHRCGPPPASSPHQQAGRLRPPALLAPTAGRSLTSVPAAAPRAASRLAAPPPRLSPCAASAALSLRWPGLGPDTTTGFLPQISLPRFLFT